MRVLLDCDGVIADWTGAVADVVRKHGGEMDLTKWFRNNDLAPDIRGKVMRELNDPDFCFMFKPLAGAIEAIKELRAAGHEVQFVTAIWDSPTWAYDRNRWLRKHGLIKSTSGVTFTKDKHIVKGDFFVDDKISNVLEWRKAWPNGIGVVWAQPWNVDYIGHTRWNDWSRLIKMVQTMGEQTAA